MIRRIIILSLLTPLFVSAAHVTFNLVPSSIYNPALLPPSTQTTLYKHGSHLVAPITRRNTFEYHDLSPGSYLLTVQCRDFFFSPLRVDISYNDTDIAGKKLQRVDAWQTFWGNEWGNKGEWKGGMVVVAGESEADAAIIELKPEQPKEYYQTRAGFSPLSFLKNPMILMALVSLALIVGMPYLMNSMDEETKAEFQELQKKSPLTQATNPAAQLQNFDLAGWMAGKSSGKGESSS